MSIRSGAALLVAGLALAACENLPYYDESLGLFSRSPYDPTIEAIEKRTPPPQDSPVLSEPPEDAAALAPPAGAVGRAGSLRTRDPIVVRPPGGGPVVAEAARSDSAAAAVDHVVVPASLPPRLRITPPMGFARSKRVILGSNRGPFQTGNMRTLR